MKSLKNFTAAAGLAALAATPALAQDGRTIGEVSTSWNLFGSHKVVVSAFEDPEIKGVTCHISRPVTGGITGTLGIAEEKSDASIACRQTGPISFTGTIERGPDGEEVFNERRSPLFKALHVTRFFDEASNTLVYLTWSDKLIDGSPKSAISTVPLWNAGLTTPVP
jgi:CreA protein